jgi:phosphoglycerate dehydrogenase-like enzyme
VSDAHVVVTFSPPGPEVRAAIDETLSPLATVTYLPELADDERRAALEAADAVLAWFISGELRPGELELLGSAKLLQLYSAGVDRVPVDDLPPQLPIAGNAGAYADPMAEHVLAMALALAKRLPQNQAKMERGEFDQETLTLAIRGATAGILGFGGIGQASARLFSALGVRIHAVNRSGRTDEPVDWIGPLDDLDALLEAADVVVVSLPLTRATRGLIGAGELALMKRDAILVNVARAAIVDEDALYEHLRANPSFSAGIDTWWQEPRVGGTFTTRHPFLELPNVIGSPHNSALTAGTLATAAGHAAENIARELRGEPVEHLVDRSEYGD